VAALSIFRRVHPALRLPHEDLEPDPGAGLDDFRRLLAIPAYRHWFFDYGDLNGAGISPPLNQRGLSRGWLSRAAQGLERTDVPGRLKAMCEHMATWHVLRDEPNLARICLAGACQTEGCFTESPLVQAMLECSTTIPTRPIYDTEETNDPGLRFHLRQEFFSHVTHPKGRDLARLDLTEAAYPIVQKTLNLLPGDHRPRLEDQYAIAFAVSGPISDLARLKSPELLEATVNRAISKASDLSDAEIEQITFPLLSGVIQFVKEVCKGCPVFCLDHLDEDMAEAFFSHEHPAWIIPPRMKAPLVPANLHRGSAPPPQAPPAGARDVRSPHERKGNRRRSAGNP